MSRAGGRTALARLEPLTVGATAPLFCGVAAGIALAGAAAAAVLDGRSAPWWAEAAILVLLAAAGAVLTVGAGPFLAPFRRRLHALVLVLLLLALVLDDAVHTSDPPALLSGPALIVLPPLLMALAVVRPPGEVLAGGLLLTAVWTGAHALLPASPLLPAQLVAGAATGAASALGASALGRVALRRLASIERDAVERGPARPPGLSVQQEAVARVEAEALPLLERVSSAGTLSPADQVLARGIAGRLRAALVADLARGWMAQAGLVVEDGRGYGERMTAGQRTAIRTALSALPLTDAAHPGSVRVDGQDRDALLRLELRLRTRPDRRRLAALVPLLRSSFSTADLRVEQREAGTVAVLVATWSVER